MKILLKLLIPLGLAAFNVWSQVEADPGGWRFTLLGPSTLVNGCPVCDRPSFPQPWRGIFQLVLQQSNALSQVYEVRGLRAYTGSQANPEILITGSGTYQINFAPPASQVMNLETMVTMQGVYTNKPKSFTNSAPEMNRTFPLLEVYLTESPGSAVELFNLTLVAAPARDLWFTTANGFTGADGLLGANGDVLSTSGRFVRRNSELLQRMGLMPGFGAYNVDALEVGPGGDLLFSLDQDVHSETLGTLHHGDLLSSKGSVAQTQAQLLSAFSLMPPVPDLGLDAVTRLPNGDILFSLKTAVFSQALGRTLRPGDLLSNRGQIHRTQEQLLARFELEAAGDYGLDAVFVWPHGEIWFSSETGFTDKNLGPIQAGDLLSDQGIIVFRNLELMSAFSPLEDLADFGLDGLYVVTDTVAPAAPARFTGLRFDQGTRTFTFDWEGDGRVFQLEKAGSPLGPWLPWQEIQPDTTSTLNAGPGAASAFFLRLRQW